MIDQPDADGCQLVGINHRAQGRNRLGLRQASGPERQHRSAQYLPKGRVPRGRKVVPRSDGGRWSASPIQADPPPRFPLCAGLDYRLVRPNGLKYVNDLDCWEWLQNVAAKGARWLEYVPWEAISDARNSEPIIRLAPCRFSRRVP
jgi:hypothetical protein